MKKWLSILLLLTLSFSEAKQQTQFSDKEFTKEISNIDQKLEDLKITVASYNYLNGLGVQTTNSPNGAPLNMERFSRISSHFGMRYHPIYHRRLMHYGVDFVAPKGTEVFATASGVVEKATYSHGYGRVVVIDHGSNIKTLYAHLNNFEVEVGDVVDKGCHIANVGNSGSSTGAHLHYELMIDEKRVNPLYLYSNDISERHIIKTLKSIYNGKSRENSNNGS